jgi:Zn-dependent metalloprotease/PKD repeat protein
MIYLIYRCIPELFIYFSTLKIKSQKNLLMKLKFTFAIVILFLVLINQSQARLTREITGAEAQQKIAGAQKIIFTDNNAMPQFVQFRKEAQIPYSSFISWAHQNFDLPAQYGFQLLNSSTDAVGITHYRYQQTWNGFPIVATMMIVHVKNTMVVSVNGTTFNKINAVVSASIPESVAFNKALNHVNAAEYRWQTEAKQQLPKGELMLAPYKGNFSDESYRLAYRFDIYATEPLKREYIFVDAVTGEIVFSLDRIHYSNSNGTAATAYSGNHPIVVDSISPTSYRLRETTRGLGVETYDLLHDSDYGAAVDFTDTDNYWNNVNANQDEYATDAHWGAEMTYDFYYIKFNRNSIDDAGMKLLSYVHYNNDYTNAFWNGNEMTYGDGGGSYTPLTSLDVAGHEISHGVTEFTSGLIYADESGGLNEAFSDCMGNAIRYYGTQPANIDWLIGDQIGGTPFRNMANPNQYENPDTYGGLYWYAPNEVHNNSGVMNFWFYLLTEGGTGTNDLGNAYNVPGLGIEKAQAICYRMNAVYLFPSAEYADARTYAIQAAQDLFGGCSPEVISTANAWYAVGVGGIFNAAVISSFTAATTSYCSIPAMVNFTNTSVNGSTYLWNFGDGDTSTVANPVHTYTTSGSYTVTLDVDGGPCGNDSYTNTNYININLPSSPTAPSAAVCPGNSATLSATGSGMLTWYDAVTGGNQLGTGSSYVTPSISSITTYYVESVISPTPQNAGAPNNSIGTGSYFTNTNYRNLIFDVYSPVTLISVNVYAGAAGNRTFTLRQGSSTLQSTTVNLPNGMSTVTLNWPLTVGSDFEIGCSGTINLYRNSSGASYPYTLNGVLSITGNNAFDLARYYFFYNWVVQGASCVSARTAVTVDLDSATADYTPALAANTVTFTDNSVATSAIVNWHWDFGDGDTSNLANPVHVFWATGTYTVCLTITDAAGCTSTTCREIPVLDLGLNQTTASSGITIYPNPVTNNMKVHFNSSSSSSWTMKLTNVIGETVAEKIMENVQGNSFEWNLSSIAPGSYTLIIENEKGERLMKKIIRQ